MNPIAFLLDPFSFGFMQRGLAATLMIGVVCAVMGTFVVLKGLAFIGDAVSHATFPGLVIAYILGLPLYIGGAPPPPRAAPPPRARGARPPPPAPPPRAAAPPTRGRAKAGKRAGGTRRAAR